MERVDTDVDYNMEGIKWPYNPKSDQRQISLSNINALLNRVVMRVKDMITLDESNWYFNKFSPLLLLKTYRDNKWEFEFWY